MSERNSADDAAKAELLDLLLEATQDGIVDWNLQTGETVYNPRWKHLLGFDCADMAEYHETPDGWRELIHPNDRAHALRLIDDHIEQGWPLHTTVRMRHRHNDYKFILVRGASRRDARDCAIRTLLVFSDIDERLREQLQRALLPDSDQPSPTDLKGLIESTVMLAADEWRDVADVELELTPGLPPVCCLGGELAQVLLGLIVNASQAIANAVGNSADKRKISISASADATHAVIRVADTGTGIPEAARGKIFEQSFTTKEPGKGAGQGLAMAYNTIVERHKGSIEFETALGVGTTFIIRLPLRSTQQVASAVST